MGSALAHLELAFLCILTLCLALLPGLPVPRAWAVVAAGLVAAQTAAVRAMRIEPFEAARAGGAEMLDTVAEAVALVVVPALTAALVSVVFWYLARANARTRHRLRRARAAAATPWGATSRQAAGQPPGTGPA